MMTGFEVYRYYLGIKLHFTTKNYNVIEAGGHVTAGQSSFMKRPDKSFFDGLAKKFDQPREVIKYLVANFAYGHNNVLYDREVGEEMMQRWIRVKESLSRMFANDLQIIENHFNKTKTPICKIGDTSDVLMLFKSGRIHIETVNLLIQFNPTWLDSWSKLSECKMLYESDLLRIKKLSSFVKVTDNCRKVWNEFEEEINCTQI